MPRAKRGVNRLVSVPLRSLRSLCENSSVISVTSVARIAITCACVSATTAAQQPSLRDVLSRLDAYLQQYEVTLASVVAEERYSQWMSVVVPIGSPEVLQRRVLVSDYALARAPGGQTWTGFRDTFEVDGMPVRDREDRLVALLSAGSAESSSQARRIAAENARFNIGDDVAARNINVPTVALDMIHPSNRLRFSFSRTGENEVDGVRSWEIRFSERSRPTMIRSPDGKDRRARGSIWVDPSTGEVLKTTLEWDGEPGGFVTVTYERDTNIGALVPVRMLEQYRRDSTTVEGEATYSNYRRFQTSGRIVK